MCVFVCLIDLFVFFNSFVFCWVFLCFFAMDTIISFNFFMILISNIILH